MGTKPFSTAFILKASMVREFRNHTNKSELEYAHKISKEIQENQRRLREARGIKD